MGQELMLIARRLRAARAERSLSSRGLADRAGIPEKQVLRMERGEYGAGVLALVRVARALEKELGWFAPHVRTPQEQTEALWCKHAKVTRPYPADLRFLAKKAILAEHGLWEPIGRSTSES